MSNVLDGLLALLAIWGGALLGLGIGVTYFLKSDAGAALPVRLVSSAFGPSLAVLFAVASIWWPEQYRYKRVGVQAFYWLQLLPLFLMAFALAKFPGNCRLHFLLVPLGMLAWAWTFVWGWVFVHGK